MNECECTMKFMDMVYTGLVTFGIFIVFLVVIEVSKSKPKG